MDDVFAFGDPREVEGDALLALTALGRDEAAGAGVLVATEDFGIAEDREAGGGDGESAGEVAEGAFEVGVFDAFGTGEFAEAFDFAFVIEEHDDAPFFGVPADEAVGEIAPFGFEHDEVAGVEGACRFAVAGCAEVFGGGGGFRGGAFTDPEVGPWGVFDADGDDEVVRADAGGKFAAWLVIGGLVQEERTFCFAADAQLGIRVEASQAFDFLAEPFDAEGEVGLP